jgi:hypothetical protein
MAEGMCQVQAHGVPLRAAIAAPSSTRNVCARRAEPPRRNQRPCRVGGGAGASRERTRMCANARVPFAAKERLFKSATGSLGRRGVPNARSQRFGRPGAKKPASWLTRADVR